MKYVLPVFVLSTLITAGCASSGAQTTGDTTATTHTQTATSANEADISPKERAALEKKFCTATLDYLKKNTDREVPDTCKGVVMRRTEQFGHGDNEGFLVTVILGEAREKIELGALLTPSGGVQLRSLHSSLNRASVQQAELEIRRLQNAVDSFYLKTSPKRLPDALGELEETQSITVSSDPWGNPYQYKKASPTEYEIFSLGPDGKAGTLDDVRVE